MVAIDGALLFLNTTKEEIQPPKIGANANIMEVEPPYIEAVVAKPEVKIINPTLQTGETLIVELSEEPAQAIFDSKEISLFPYQKNYRVLIPLPLGTKSGNYTLKTKFKDGTVIEKTITLQTKEQQIIVLPPPPKLGLTAKQIVQNLSVANMSLKEIVAEVENITRFNKPFGLPVDKNFIISSPFGEIRKTGEENIVHLGADFDVLKGTPVYAINDGVVKKAYLDQIYGNSIVIDHGRGIYSLYLHLDRMDVKTGAVVQKGALIGAAGDSGLANAPHLHLSLKINGVAVDPVQFIETFK